MLAEPRGLLLVPRPLDSQSAVQQEGPAAGAGVHGVAVALAAAPHGLDDATVLGGQRALQAGQGPAAGRVSVHPPHQATQALGARSDQVHHTGSLLAWQRLDTDLCARLPMARRGDVDSLQKAREKPVALVELGEAVLADKLRQSWVLEDSHPQQTLEVPDENTLPGGWSLGALPRCPAGDAAQTPGGELPVAEATVAHGQGPGCSCLVGAVLARVRAGPRGAPAQPRRHQSRRLGHGRPAAGGAAPGPATAIAAAAGAPALPGRQEAAEPVPFHGCWGPAPALGPARSAGLFARQGSGWLGPEPPVRPAGRCSPVSVPQRPAPWKGRGDAGGAGGGQRGRAERGGQGAGPARRARLRRPGALRRPRRRREAL